MEARESETPVADLLRRLPEPDPAALPRIWRRFETTRARSGGSSSRWMVWVPVAALAGAAVAAVALLPEPERIVTLSAAGEQVIHQWSDQVLLRLSGHGTASGTARDVVVQWESGTLRVDVEPETGTALSVVTEEAVIRVVGTAFEVRRDPLGVTTTVEHGRVAVTCEDGWRGVLTVEQGPHTCLPTRSGALLGRAEFLEELGATAETVLETLDLGLAQAEAGSAVEGELLVRRLRTRGALGLVEGALADADRYLATEDHTRAAEVLRSAGRLALSAHGCGGAAKYLTALEATGTAEDRVLLASCLPDDPARAEALVRASLASGEPIDPAWQRWATSFLGGRP